MTVPGQSTTMRPIRSGERWTHLLCAGCGNHIPRSQATQRIDGATGPLEIDRIIRCANEDCRDYGGELMRSLVDPFVSDYFETRVVPKLRDAQP